MAKPDPLADYARFDFAHGKWTRPVFRKGSVVSWGERQYVGFYDGEGRVVLAMRTLGASEWTVRQTPLTGRVQDAHNSISLGVDGDGLLHLAWDHHSSPLRYCAAKAPGRERSAVVDSTNAPMPAASPASIASRRATCRGRSSR